MIGPLPPSSHTVYPLCMRPLSLLSSFLLCVSCAPAPAHNAPASAATAGAEEEAPPPDAATPPSEPPPAPEPSYQIGELPPLDVDAPPAYATTEASGLAHLVLREGTGEAHPRRRSEVRVHYSGWTTDGELFDSSVSRGSPATFPLNRVIDGWTEGVQLMVEGEVRRFWIPANLAYEGSSNPDVPQGMLVFDVELLSIVTP